MKSKFYFFIVFIFFFFSCDDGANLTVQNKLNHSNMTDIYWGDERISYSLMPGESVRDKIYGYHLPEENPLSFCLSNKGKIIYLETKVNFLINTGDDIIIEIDEDVEVINPAFE